MTEDEAAKITPPFNGSDRWNKRAHDPEKCCASIYHGNFSWSQCTRKPAVYHGSLGYCRTHDPEAILRKRKARDAQWQAEIDTAKRLDVFKKAQSQFVAEAIAVVRQIAAGHNDPRALAMELLDREPKP